MRAILTWIVGNLIAIVIGLIIGVKYNEKFSKIYVDVKKLVIGLLEGGVQLVKDIFD